MADNPFEAEIQRRQSNPFAAELQRRQGATPFGAVPPGAETGQFGGSTNPRAFEQAVELADPVLQGLTFGFGDELTAAVSPASLEEVRERSARIREEQPGASMAAEVGGGLITGGGLAPVVGRAAAATPVIRNLPAMARFGLGGAGAGAIAGAGTSEGGERAEGAVEGAAIGGALGVALPVAGRAAAAVLTPLLNRVQGPTRQAIERIQRALQRDEMTTEDARDQLQELGVNATIADVGGENVQGLAIAAQRIPGRGRTAAREVLETRQAGQSGRIADTINDTLGQGGEFRQTRDALIQSRKTNAQPLYDRAYAQEIPNSTELQALLGRPAISQAYTRARTIAANEGETLPEVLDTTVAPSMRTLDFIKRGLDDVIETSRDPLTGALRGDVARGVASSRRELVGLIDDANPDYKAARAVYAGDSASIDALNQGRRLGNSLNRKTDEFDPEQILDDLDRMNDAEKSFFRQGLARGLIDVVESVPDTADAVKRLIGTEGRRGRLRAAFPDGEAFTRFMTELNRELRFFETRGAVLGGSQTARNVAEQADLLTGGSSTGFQNPLRGGAVESAGRGLAALVNRVSRPSPDLAGEVSQILTAQGPQATRLIDLIGSTPSIPPALQRGGLSALVEAERQGGSFPNR